MWNFLTLLRSSYYDEKRTNSQIIIDDGSVVAEMCVAVYNLKKVCTRVACFLVFGTNVAKNTPGTRYIRIGPKLIHEAPNVC